MALNTGVMLRLGFQLVAGLALMYMLKGQTMEGLLSADGSFSPDGFVKQIKQYATLRYWVSGPEAPAYQQYVKTGITFYLLFYLMQIPKVPIMVCSKTNFNGALIRTCPVFTSKYWPTLWMPVGRMQGLGMEVLARFRLSYQDPASAWTREKLLSKSGHGITVDQLNEPNRGPLPDTVPVVLILNDSCSGSHSYETITLAEQLRDLGIRTYALNARGAANADMKVVGETKLAFNTISGTSDLRETLVWLYKRHKGVRITAISFGTASAAVINYLNQEGKKALVESAVCISPAMHMASLAEPGWLQNRFQLGRLKREVLGRHATVLEEELGVDAVAQAMRVSTVAQFHEAVTMQVCGDEPDDSSYSDYLTAHSVTTLGPGIARPLLCVCSKDDPHFSFKDTVPPEMVRQFKNHEHAILCVVRHGGHKCFFQNMAAKNWASSAAVQFMRSVSYLKKQQQKKR